MALRLNPSEAVARWIVSRLDAAGITERIDRGVSPIDDVPDYPGILLTSQSGPQSYTLGVQEGPARVTYLVRSVDESWDTVSVADLESRVHAALQDAPMYEESGGWRVFNCYRDRVFESNDAYEGRMIRSQGGYYVIEVQ